MPAIKYFKVSNRRPVVDFLVDRLERNLKNDRGVLWLVPGGSAMAVAVEVAKRLGPQPKLTITLSDERYGPVDHPDSNWRQLAEAGFFVPKANLIPVLSGGSPEQTAKSYGRSLAELLEQADYSLALTGIGPDGHIFGIKPHSPAVSSSLNVVGFAWDDYTRLTPTAKLISALDEIVVFATGEQKHAQFDRLEKKLSIDQQPAQLLKQSGRVTIFNDYKGVSL